MPNKNSSDSLNVEAAVKNRYSQAAKSQVTDLCIPISYNEKYLKIIPQEIIDRDYGCGDPTEFIKKGDRVLDLGSGTGKACYIAAQIVGPDGSVTGVDMNDDMLELAKKHQNEIAQKLGHSNVEFKKGKIQDLKLDVTLVENYLEQNPVNTMPSLEALEDFQSQARKEKPLIPSNSIDVVISNCVLNLVRNEQKAQLISEIYRVLDVGGRIAISDIVSDEKVPQALQDNPDLWAGCISGSFQEQEFLEVFEKAGFYGISLAKRNPKPWRVIEGIEFRSVTVVAYKGKDGPCLERNQAVLYTGPWKEVLDDDGHRLRRGERVAVCDKTFNLFSKEPYRSSIAPIPPYQEIPLSEAEAFPCNGTQTRPPQATKGKDYKLTTADPGSACAVDSNGSCC